MAEAVEETAGRVDNRSSSSPYNVSVAARVLLDKKAQGMRLLSVALLKDRVTDWSSYPFAVPAIRTLERLEIRSPMCFFVGENGSGKSTLIEAIAESYGFGREGGSRSFFRESADSVLSTTPLSNALRLSFTKRTGQGIFLRAESFFNVATEVDRLGLHNAYGNLSLHAQSHGESFLALLQNRFSRRGFYILDEPEAALSPQRQLAMLAILHNLLKDNREIQFLISTHSPILLAYPNAQILSFDGGVIHETAYRDTGAYQTVARFVSRPEVYVREIFDETSNRNED